MDKNPGAKQFWRLCGPILLYWGIEFVVKFVADMIAIAPHMAEIMRNALSTGNTTQKDLMELAMKNADKVYKILLQYQVQIITVGAICTIPLTAYLFYADRKKERGMVPSVIEKVKLWKYIEIIGLGIAVCIGLNCLSILSNLAFASTQYQKTSEALYSASVPAQFLCLGLIIPFAEELMFRGVLFKRYRESGSFLKAALFSTILFSMTHGNIVQFLYTFALGMFLSYVYEKFGSFKAPVLLHIAVNCASLSMTHMGGFTWLAADTYRMAIVTVLCAFVGAVMFVLIQRIEVRTDDPEPPKDEITPDMFR